MADALHKIRSFWARNSSATMRLIIINVAFTLSVWVVSAFSIDKSGSFVQVPSSFIELAKKPYTIITYMFSHDSLTGGGSGIFHLLFNMIMLYFIGRVFEDLLGKMRTYQTYFVGGFFGALGFILLDSNSILVGASGAVMGLMYGLTVLRPNYEFFLYGFLRLKLWWVTVAYAFFDLLGILAGSNDGGRICHVAGGLAGALLVMIWTGRISNFIPQRPSKSARSMKPNKVTVARSPNRPAQTKTNRPAADGVPTQQEIDAILDKINESGYDNLTKKEKETLFRARDIEV